MYALHTVTHSRNYTCSALPHGNATMGSLWTAVELKRYFVLLVTKMSIDLLEPSGFFTYQKV